jgi:hypothetical protein
MADTENNGWKFAQCFGDKGEIEEVSDGNSFYFFNF